MKMKNRPRIYYLEVENRFRRWDFSQRQKSIKESQLIVGSVFPLALTCSIYYMTLMFGIISYC